MGFLCFCPPLATARSVEETAVLNTLSRLTDSFTKGDIENLLLCVSPRFLAQNPEIPGRLRAFFEQYENISLDYKVASINIADDIATVKLNWTKTMNNPMNNWRYRDVGKNIVIYFSAVKPFNLIGLEESNIFGVSFLLQTKIVIPMSTAKLEEARKELELAERRMALKRSNEELEAQKREESERQRRERMAIIEARKKAREQAKQEIIQKKLAAKAEREAAEAEKRAAIMKEAARAKAEQQKEAQKQQAEEQQVEQQADVPAPQPGPPGQQQPLSPEELAQIARLIKAASATFDERPVSMDPGEQARISEDIRESTDTKAAELFRIQQRRQSAITPPPETDTTPTDKSYPDIPAGFTSWRDEQLETIRALHKQSTPEQAKPALQPPLQTPPTDPKLEQEIRRKTDTQAIRLLAEKQAREKQKETEQEISPSPEESPETEPDQPDPEEQARQKALEKARQEAIMRSKALQSELALSDLTTARKQESETDIQETLAELQSVRDKAAEKALARMAEEEAREAELARQREQALSIDVAKMKEIEEKAALEAEIRERANAKASELLLKKMIPEQSITDDTENKDEIESVLADLTQSEKTPEEALEAVKSEAEERAELIKAKQQEATPVTDEETTFDNTDIEQAPPAIEDDIRDKALQDAQALLKKFSLAEQQETTGNTEDTVEHDKQAETDKQPAPNPKETKREELIRKAAEQAAAIQQDLGIISDSQTQEKPAEPKKAPARPGQPAQESTETPKTRNVMPEMRLVRGGRQPNGPDYDFMMSKYEVTNRDFCKFLNDAMKNPNHIRGRHMFFDNNGNVFMDASGDNQKKLFSMTNLDFGGKQTGIQYKNGAYSPLPGKENHPVVGVSWYGAIKYCNWLTIASGYGDKNLAYSEGPTPMQWRPITVTDDEWLSGFSDIERRQWINRVKGFRLPMNNYDSEEGPFNEFYMASAWNSKTNTLYGFGRDRLTPADANFKTAQKPFPGTTPVGYYDGTDHEGTFQTNPNQNQYDIYDLSGNVWEWGNDSSGNMAYRIVFGGSFEGDPDSLRTPYRGSINPHNTCDNVGIRLVSGIPE